MLMHLIVKYNPTNEKNEEHDTPSVSRIVEFVGNIRNEVEGKRQGSHVVLVVDLGTEENRCGTNPLPVDWSILLVDLTHVQMTDLFFVIMECTLHRWCRLQRMYLLKS